MKTYGPYVAKDGRYRCMIVHEDGRRQIVSYPRLVMEAHLGVSLSPEVDVHHKDGNVANNDVSNLEVIDHKVHCREHSLKYKEAVNVLCLYCSEVFSLTPKRQSQRARDTNRPFPKAGPFCSRTCSGKYGTDVQRSRKAGMPSLNTSKFGEPLPMATPSQASDNEEGVETRHSSSRTDEGIVQTTNNTECCVGGESRSGKKIRRE